MEQNGVHGEAPAASSPPPAIDLQPQPEAKATRLSRVRTELFPIPVYATLPSEGSTYGLMPVVLRVERSSGRTEDIFAPSLTYNSVIGLTLNARWYRFFRDSSTLSATAAIARRTNRSILIHYRKTASEPYSLYLEGSIRGLRSIFFRFYGLGPRTTDDEQTSHTRTLGKACALVGVALPHRMLLGGMTTVEREAVSAHGVRGLPLSTDRFPGVPGMRAPSTTMLLAATLRYDSRDAAEHSEQGVLAALQVGRIVGLAGSRSANAAVLDVRALMPAFRRLGLASRLYVSFVGSTQLPFYRQSLLGGAYTLRGLMQDRYVGAAAWTFELEPRLILFTLRARGVTVDARIDPFVAVGQVANGPSDLFVAPQVTYGLGLRVFVRPNVVGRLDIGMHRASPQLYVELGLPF